MTEVSTSNLKRNGLGTAALVLGIVAIAGAFIPFLNIASLIIGIVGLILGIVGLFLKEKAKGRALAGTIISLVAVIVSIIVLSVTAAAVSSAVKTASTSGTSEVSGNTSGSNVVTYEITSDGKTASSVTYATFDANGGGTKQATDAALPFKVDVKLADASIFSTSIYSLVAQAGDGATTITCKVLHNGKEISSNTSTGAYAVVTCSGTGD
jgi:LytS/YehU family sensor histidine kinase